MTLMQAVVTGKEQLILLPVQQQVFQLTTDPSITTLLDTGGHAIVASGYAGISHPDGTVQGFFLNDVDDEDVFTYEVHFLVGPLWRDVVQVSASVSLGGILSLDSDDVDSSRWVVSECDWDVVEEPDGERIRIKIKIQTQGEQNGWENFAYRVVATGWLRRMPTPDEISADLS